jgi:hypothetical protein
MAGLPWYQIWTEFPVHPKTLALCAAVRDDNAGMYVIRLWSHCANHALDGVVQAAVVESICGWRKKRGALLTALQTAGIVEPRAAGTALVHGWEERNGKRIRDWVRDNAKRKPKKGDPAELPQDYHPEPHENPAGFSLETPEEPRCVDGRTKTEKNPEAAAAASAEPPSTLASLTAQRISPASADDDVPRRRLELVDEARPHASAPPTMVETFRRRLAERLARTALHPVGGGKPVLDAVETSLRTVPLERAVEACAQSVFDAVKAGRKPLQTLAGFVHVLADVELAFRAAGLARIAESSGCTEWDGAVAAARRAIAGDFADRLLVPLRPRLAGDVLELRAPEGFPAAFVREQHGDRLAAWVAEAAGRPLQVRIVEAATLAAGGQA